MMKDNEKGKGNGLLPLVTQPTPKSSFPYFKLLLLLLIPTALYGLQHTVRQQKDHHLFGKKAETAYLYVLSPLPAKPLVLTLLIGSSVPNEANAIEASRLFATKPHLAGSPGDLTTAKDFLHLLETELGIKAPSTEPIFAAGSPESQHATRSISKTHQPRAWIDTYYPVMNTPLERTLQIVDKNGTVIWQADLIEEADETDPEAGKYFDSVPIFHGLSRGGDVTGKLVDGKYCFKEVSSSIQSFFSTTNLKKKSF